MLELTVMVIREIRPGGVKEWLEKFLESSSRSATATKVLLALVGIGGLIFVGAVAPNAVQLLKHYPLGKKYSKQQWNNAFHNLKRQGLITVYINTDGKKIVRLTPKGERKVKRLELDGLAIVKPKRWDGKWRVLIFDIPVQFSKVREALRWQIKDLGFYQLQRSVWVYPYPCERELLFVANFFGVLNHIEILTVEKLLDTDSLRRHFGLK